MAKVYESDIDPDEFIRSFRDDPSGISSMKKKSTEEKTSENPQSEVKAQPTGICLRVTHWQASIGKAPDQGAFVIRLHSHEVSIGRATARGILQVESSAPMSSTG